MGLGLRGGVMPCYMFCDKSESWMGLGLGLLQIVVVTFFYDTLS